ncbi:hypothetical protein ACQKBP_07460 [Helicobacter pylori]
MRQTNETATSFKELAEITQSIQANQTLTQANQTLTQANENANISALTHKRAQKPKPSQKAKKGALKPTKRAFSDRETTLKGKSQTSAKESLEAKQANKKGGNHEAQ